ncbi:MULTISPECIES: ribbon-helix-helix domain-containing protein [Xanthomonas]|nr:MULTISPECIES: ribbon-helix-helix domain-containing protein [Xanthomonas]MBV6783167.1 ribbon-helix-helix domain-containing protein [Xanthomonas campestris pv. trichodesmae]MCF5931062.1 ribbon-helix-helix domain-containing protein [Xanthomonas perforans]MCF5951820.1 ribbon-helix-helix domain-containing protein [Xanthomonas perforans]MCF5957440.1 ribbon-helix-helix domain-containing protein [Xanthomonas perforans]MCF5961288.1 ribbon-helix-helix domain-containing protein [Xanthomonas perforans]
MPPELFIASMMGGLQNCSNLQQSAAGADYMANDSQNSVRVTTTLTRQQHAYLEHIAEQNGVKVAWLVRRAVENLIEQAQVPLFLLDIREGRSNA